MTQPELAAKEDDVTSRGPAGPVADGRAPSGARADVSDRLAGRPARRRPGHPPNRGPGRLAGSRRGSERDAGSTSAGWGSTGMKDPTSAVRRHPTSSRNDCRIIEDLLDRLKASESVYPCTCTRADIERAASAPHPEDEGPTYPGTCAYRRAADAGRLGDRPFAWRFRVPAGPVGWDDLFLGPIELDPRGWAVISSSPGTRSAHRISSPSWRTTPRWASTKSFAAPTSSPALPRQILLYRQLGWPEPRFGHVPLAVTPDGRRLAKRDGSVKLSSLREAGRRSAPARRFLDPFVRLVRFDRPDACRATRSIASTRRCSPPSPGSSPRSGWRVYLAIRRGSPKSGPGD